MITLTREEAQQVLDDLEALTAYIQGIDKGIVLKTQSIETLCARLAQPEPDIVQDAIVYGTGIAKDGKRIDPASIYKEPEPVAWEYCGALFYDKEEVFAWHERGDIGSTPPKPLYSAPPHRKPWDNKVLITDEYERGVIDGMQKQMQSSVDKAVNKMAKREEGCAECGKKSSDGWALYCVKCSEISEPDQDDGVCGNCNGDGCKFCDARFLLQREWQGLTAKDLAEIPPSCFEGAIWADARLKEKNSAT